MPGVLQKTQTPADLIVASENKYFTFNILHL